MATHSSILAWEIPWTQRLLNIREWCPLHWSSMLTGTMLGSMHYFIQSSLQQQKGFPVGSGVKNVLAMQEMWQELQVQFLGQEDPLEMEMATHSSILAWKLPWTAHGVAKELDTRQRLNNDVQQNKKQAQGGACTYLVEKDWDLSTSTQQQDRLCPVLPASQVNLFLQCGIEVTHFYLGVDCR